MNIAIVDTTCVCAGCARKAPDSDSHASACPKRLALKEAIRTERAACEAYWDHKSDGSDLGRLGMEVEIARWALSR